MGETHLLEKRDWDLTIDINVRGLVNVIRSAYPRLIAQGYGHLVNTASVAGLIGSPFLSVYVGTKHFVVGVSKSMRIEAAQHGVRVSALCPGAVKTPLLTGGSIGRSIYEMSEARKLAWWERFRPGDVDVFAKQTLDAVAKNEAVIVLPKHNRIGVALFRMVPGLEEKVVSKLYAKTLADFPEMRAPKKPAAAAAVVAQGHTPARPSTGERATTSAAPGLGQPRPKTLKSLPRTAPRRDCGRCQATGSFGPSYLPRSRRRSSSTCVRSRRTASGRPVRASLASTAITQCSSNDRRSDHPALVEERAVVDDRRAEVLVAADVGRLALEDRHRDGAEQIGVERHLLVRRQPLLRATMGSKRMPGMPRPTLIGRMSSSVGADRRSDLVGE